METAQAIRQVRQEPDQKQGRSFGEAIARFGRTLFRRFQNSADEAVTKPLESQIVTTETPVTLPPITLAEPSLPISATVPTPKVSNKAAREARIRAYQEAKQAEAAIPVQTQPKIDSPVVSQPTSTAESRESSASQVLNLTPEDLPWLKKAEKITLSEVVIPGSDKRKYYFGEAIIGKLVEPITRLSAEQKRSTQHMLSVHLPELITKGYNPHVKLVRNPSTERPIYYLGNKAGQRVYFMRWGNLDGIPVIVQIAACDKAEQDETLSVLTTKDRRDIKKFSKL